MIRAKAPIDLEAVRRWRVKLRAIPPRPDRSAELFAAVLARADELRAEGDDVTEAAVGAALDVLGGGRDGR